MLPSEESLLITARISLTAIQRCHCPLILTTTCMVYFLNYNIF